jgi:hypothetical protein
VVYFGRSLRYMAMQHSSTSRCGGESSSVPYPDFGAREDFDGEELILRGCMGSGRFAFSEVLPVAVVLVRGFGICTKESKD